MGHRNQQVILIRDEPITMEILETEDIIGWAETDQETLRIELEDLIPRAFPKLSDHIYRRFIQRHFRLAAENCRRYVMLFRNVSDRLVATTLFDYGNVPYGSDWIKGIYINVRAILPEYQKFKLGQTISLTIFSQFSPDMLLTTCTQSSSLHSWVGLPAKGLITGYAAYPRLEITDEKERLVPIPESNLSDTVIAFKHLYLSILGGDTERLDRTLLDLTVRMVRKDNHDSMYDFNPWEKDGREDKLAKALHLTDRDGVLVVFHRIPNG